jgi:hypothetical protein
MDERLNLIFAEAARELMDLDEAEFSKRLELSRDSELSKLLLYANATNGSFLEWSDNVPCWGSSEREKRKPEHGDYDLYDQGYLLDNADPALSLQEGPWTPTMAA